MSQFLDSINYIKNNYKRYDEWEQNQTDNAAKREYLSKQLELPKDKVELTKAKAEAVFRASDLMDKRSEDNSANMEQTTGMVEAATLLPILGAITYYPMHLAKKSQNMTPKQSIYFNIIAAVATLIPAIGISLWGNMKQKEASRIGRFQAKQHELKDPNNFVMYTPEQIEAAKLLVKNLPQDKKDKKTITELVANMKQISQDKVEYKKWLQEKIHNESDIQKILNTQFSSEQIEQGKEDKEIITNIIKDVNMTAETYSENVENAFDTLELMAFVTDIPLYAAVNKLMEKFKASPAIKKFAPIAVATLFPLAILFWATREKKKASRVGRFVKRQEILNNPKLIMSYSDKQLKQAENIKGEKVKKGFFKEIQENLTFFPKYLKETKEYDKYKKTTEKENEKLYEALKQTNISEAQLKAAKNLQQKTFLSFEKVDEMSQRYSEDMEAATEITLQLSNFLFSMIGLGIPVALVLSIKKGKFPLNGLLKNISNLTLKKDSEFRNFANNAYEIINKDSELKKDFSRVFFDKKVQEKFITHPRLQPLYSDLISQNQKYFDDIIRIKDEQNFEEFQKLSKSFINEHFKQDLISKWFRNLTGDILKLRGEIKYKINIFGNTMEKVNPFASMKKFYKEHKTLSNSVLLGGFAPFIAITTGIPFAIESFMTNLQLKAGRIGIMQAMEDLDNPKLFADEKVEIKEEKQNNQTSNLLSNYRKKI
jgi:hypothetical protein